MSSSWQPASLRRWAKAARTEDVEDILVEKQQGREGLSLGGGGDLLLGSQVAQKLPDFCYAHGGGMAEFVEADVFLVPRDVGFLGADGVSAQANGLAQTVG